MVPAYQIRRRARQAVVPILSAVVLAYVGYHTVQGDRGIGAWVRLSQQIDQTRAELATLRDERETLERQVALLRPENLDRDMLDERARLVLGLARPDELIFLSR
jgi:cell division protein FtsB